MGSNCPYSCKDKGQVSSKKPTTTATMANVLVPRPSFKIKSSRYEIERHTSKPPAPHACGKQALTITYPTDFTKGPFPIVTYGHGMKGNSPQNSSTKSLRWALSFLMSMDGV